MLFCFLPKETEMSLSPKQYLNVKCKLVGYHHLGIFDEPKNLNYEIITMENSFTSYNGFPLKRPMINDFDIVSMNELLDILYHFMI